MQSLVLWSLAIVMMLSGANCISQSQSCSTVNGNTICETQRSDGNFAGASSGAYSGGDSSYQQASAGTGNTRTGTSSSSTSSQGNFPGFGPALPPLPFNPFSIFGGGAFAGAFAGRR